VLVEGDDDDVDGVGYCRPYDASSSLLPVTIKVGSSCLLMVVAEAEDDNDDNDDLDAKALLRRTNCRNPTARPKTAFSSFRSVRL
jgi:hypothetical protein